MAFFVQRQFRGGRGEGFGLKGLAISLEQDCMLTPRTMTLKLQMVEQINLFNVIFS